VDDCPLEKIAISPQSPLDIQPGNRAGLLSKEKMKK